MASTRPARTMTNGRKRRSLADFSDDDSDVEPVQPTRRAHSQAMVAVELDEDEEAQPTATTTATATAKQTKKGRWKSKTSTRSAQGNGAARGSRQDAEASNADEEAAEESEEDADDTQLQEMMDFYEYQATQTNAVDAPVSEGEKNKLVRSVMRFMLFRQQQKPGVPVKRDELTKLVLAGYKTGAKSRLGNFVIQQAMARFPAVFGMEMKEVATKVMTKQGEADGPKVFILRSLLSDKLRSFVKSGPTELSQALAMVALPLIALAGGKLSEEELWMQLEKLGIRQNGVHPVLGKAADQIETLVQKKYLAESKENGPNGTYKVYAISSVAVDEIQEDKLTAFIDGVFSHAPASQPE